MDKFKAFLDQISSVLQGEPVLVIGNGAAVVIYLVARVVGTIPDESFEFALGQAAAAIAVVNTILVTIRQYVSPAA